MSLASLLLPWLSFNGPWVSCCLNTMTPTIAASDCLTGLSSTPPW